jgi:hypothetical protein
LGEAVAVILVRSDAKSEQMAISLRVYTKVGKTASVSLLADNWC